MTMECLGDIADSVSHTERCINRFSLFSISADSDIETTKNSYSELVLLLFLSFNFCRKCFHSQMFISKTNTCPGFNKDALFLAA